MIVPAQCPRACVQKLLVAYYAMHYDAILPINARKVMHVRNPRGPAARKPPSADPMTIECGTQTDQEASALVAAVAADIKAQAPDDAVGTGAPADVKWHAPVGVAPAADVPAVKAPPAAELPAAPKNAGMKEESGTADTPVVVAAAPRGGALVTAAPKRARLSPAASPSARTSKKTKRRRGRSRTHASPRLSDVAATPYSSALAASSRPSPLEQANPDKKVVNDKVRLFLCSVTRSSHTHLCGRISVVQCARSAMLLHAGRIGFVVCWCTVSLGSRVGFRLPSPSHLCSGVLTHGVHTLFCSGPCHRARANLQSCRYALCARARRTFLCM